MSSFCIFVGWNNGCVISFDLKKKKSISFLIPTTCQRLEPKMSLYGKIWHISRMEAGAHINPSSNQK